MDDLRPDNLDSHPPDEGSSPGVTTADAPRDHPLAYPGRGGWGEWGGERPSRPRESEHKGSIAEEFYVEYRARTGAPVERHMRLDPANNIAGAETVFPDGMDIHGAEVGEVKATEIGLAGRDETQIATVLDAIDQNGVAKLTDSSGKVHDAKFMRLTFTNPKGAYGSRATLGKWLKKYPFLTVEVFDAAGTRRELRGRQTDLEATLRAYVEG